MHPKNCAETQTVPAQKDYIWFVFASLLLCYSLQINMLYTTKFIVWHIRVQDRVDTARHEREADDVT